MEYSFNESYSLFPEKRRNISYQNLELNNNIESTPQLSNNSNYQECPSCENAAPTIITIKDTENQNINNSSSNATFDKEPKITLIQSEKENEGKYTKRYFVKINLILYIIYFIFFTIISLASLYSIVFVTPYRSVMPIYIFNGILFILVFICGFRELCYVITMDIKNKKLTRKLYTINSFLFCYCCFSCNRIEINLREVDYFWNRNYCNFKGNCLCYQTSYYYYLGVIFKDKTKKELIKKNANISASGLLFLGCFLYHRFSKNRFNFDKLVNKLNNMLEENKEYINQE